MSIMTQIADTDHAIAVLDDWLRSQDYTRGAREGIRNHVREHGTLEGASPRFLDREHVETATEVLVDAFPPVTYSSPEWGTEGYWTPSDVYRLSPPELDDIDVPDAPDFAVTQAPGYAAALAADGITLLPISGGGPDDPPYEPTEADRREYAAFSDQLDNLRAWYDRNGDDSDRPMGQGFIAV
jgi:hypothetical protein